MHRSDYLVIGAGATALAFVDSVFHETDATFTIVDRRDAPGGHWNDAYPFVRLHQPAWMYGIASQPFGSLAIESTGPNRGFTSLASGVEVVDHFHRFLRETLLPSGRVTYLPLSEYRAGEVVSLLSGETTRVEATTVVDATLLEAVIPLTHEPSFAVADGASVVPPNALARQAPRHRHFAVLGAGKTAIDTVMWLLGGGARPDQITWVRPREAWLIGRELHQPGSAFMASTADAMARQYAAIAAATSLEDLALRMEEAGLWRRLDRGVTPTMFHGATVSAVEVDLARTVLDVVRGSRVTAVEPDRLVLADGDTHALPPGTLTIDCTAAGLGRNIGVSQPVFSPGRIALQPIRQYQPTFSAALIGHLEASVPDPAERAALARVAPMTDTVADWAAGHLATLHNQSGWLRHPAVRAWLATCRLDLTSTWGDPEVDPDARRAAVSAFAPHLASAAENLHRLLGGAALGQGAR